MCFYQEEQADDDCLPFYTIEIHKWTHKKAMVINRMKIACQVVGHSDT